MQPKQLRILPHCLKVVKYSTIFHLSSLHFIKYIKGEVCPLLDKIAIQLPHSPPPSLTAHSYFCCKLLLVSVSDCRYLCPIQFLRTIARMNIPIKQTTLTKKTTILIHQLPMKFSLILGIIVNCCQVMINHPLQVHKWILAATKAILHNQMLLLCH